MGGEVMREEIELGRSAPQRVAGQVVGVVAALVVILVAVVVAVLLTRDDSGHTTVPPLTATQQQAGIIRVSYPDRSLPDQPSVTTVAGKRVTLYFDRVEGSSRGTTAELRVGVDGARPTSITLTKGESTQVHGVEVTLVAAYNTGDLSEDAADVTVR